MLFFSCLINNFLIERNICFASNNSFSYQLQCMNVLCQENTKKLKLCVVGTMACMGSTLVKCLMSKCLELMMVLAVTSPVQQTHSVPCTVHCHRIVTVTHCWPPSLMPHVFCVPSARAPTLTCSCSLSPCRFPATRRGICIFPNNIYGNFCCK